MRKEIAEAVRRGVEAGASRAEIARAAGVSATTVTRYAWILGFPAPQAGLVALKPPA